MKIKSCNTGVPQFYEFQGTRLKTSMVRSPQKKIWIGKTQVQGDEFAGPAVHGTKEAVVYALSIESYSNWSQILDRPVPLGFFGENLSVEGLKETDFFIDDIWGVGDVRLLVTGPRYPCNRLNFVTQRSDMRDLFAEKAWPGVYFSVLSEGFIEPNDELVLQERKQSSLNVNDVFLAMRSVERKEPKNIHVERALAYSPLWDRFQDKIKKHYG